MLIRLIQVGKTNAGYLQEGIREYESRLQHYIRFETITIDDLKNRSKMDEPLIKKKEGEQILQKIDASDFVILLDEKGKTNSSIQFAKLIEKHTIQATKTLVFVIGGAYGFSDELYQRAQSKLSLSPMTFSHQMVRLFFVEQVYRAMTIMRGEKYHHG